LRASWNEPGADRRRGRIRRLLLDRRHDADVARCSTTPTPTTARSTSDAGPQPRSWPRRRRRTLRHDLRRPCRPAC
jgi:hypothetical protein